MNRADEFGDAREDFRRGGKLILKRTFGTRCRAGNQIHFDAGFRAQAKDGGNGVFLGAADNEPSDDVGDAHRAFSLAGP